MLRIVTVFRGNHHLASKRAYDEALRFFERMKFSSLSANNGFEPLLLKPLSQEDTAHKSLVVSSWDNKPDYDRFLQTYLNSQVDGLQIVDIYSRYYLTDSITCETPLL